MRISSKRYAKEFKVGLLLTLAFALVMSSVWLLSFTDPLGRSIRFYVTYNFAGGIEKGSPVRVAGVKVGQVENVELFPVFNKEQAIPVRLTVSILKEASRGIRKDSKFYINMASVMGERYLEITPGTSGSPTLEPLQTFAGIDPPRIDQLISQSFSVAGKISDLIDEHREDLSKNIRGLAQLGSFLGDPQLKSLIGNLAGISRDLKVLSAQANTEESKKALELVYKLLQRLEPLDKEAVQTFFQKQGVKAKIF